MKFLNLFRKPKYESPVEMTTELIQSIMRNTGAGGSQFYCGTQEVEGTNYIVDVHCPWFPSTFEMVCIDLWVTLKGKFANRLINWYPKNRNIDVQLELYSTPGSDNWRDKKHLLQIKMKFTGANMASVDNVRVGGVIVYGWIIDSYKTFEIAQCDIIDNTRTPEDYNFIFMMFNLLGMKQL